MSLGASEMSNVASTLAETDESKLGNRADVEFQWAIKAYHHAETYTNLIMSVEPQFLKLTQIDDEIYTKFRAIFPDFNVDVVEESTMKTAESKEKWRGFCNHFENRVEDFNMGTLIRIKSKEEFSEPNSMLVVRIQFLAIEITRNREGYNDELRKTKGKKSS